MAAGFAVHMPYAAETRQVLFTDWQQKLASIAACVNAK
jgi:hypothetical protein